jgi:DNA helicase-2/ATP-dependent DNA helicase PcrA
MISYAQLADALDKVGPQPNLAQALAVEAAKDEPLFVVAGPGTGKTATLTMRMLKLVFVDQVAPRGILATTFTRKAAAELRSRILSWGYGVQEHLLTEGRLSKVDRLWVEQVDINQVRTGTIDSICEELLRDFRDPGVDPPILADEFVARTLLLREGMFGNGVRRDQDPDLDRFLCDIRGTGRYGWNVSAKVDLAQTLWDRRFHDQIAWPNYISTGGSASDQRARQVLDDVMEDYARALGDRLMVDFAQLEQTVLDRLRQGGLKEFTDELEVVLVDEYQDTNLLQESLYFELAKRCNGALTVVGDDDQSLYRFRGATVELFSDFENRFQRIGGFGKRPTRVFLNANYRSTRTIIDFVDDYATFDAGYQTVRVGGKPRLVNPAAQAGGAEPAILGMFRDGLDELADDLAGFVYQVTRGRGYRLPTGLVIRVDKDKGGDVGDCALLCSSPREFNSSGKPRLPSTLKNALLRQPKQIHTFNPRGQDFASIGAVQRLGGLLVKCLDPHRQAADQYQRALGQDTRHTLDLWEQIADGWLAGAGIDPRLVRYVDHWSRRQPERAGEVWPKYVSCLELLYGLVHWLPELHDDPEGQIYLEVFTRQLGAAEQVSGFRAQVVTDPSKPDLAWQSVGHLLLYFLAPIADGTAKVDEELMESFPRDRLSILSIHQSKGLEFPLVIVDVGADFRTNHHAHAFKRFPQRPATPHLLEDSMRPHSPLGVPRRAPVDRAFDDLYRQYFVAFSRPQDVLLLVGLTESHPDQGQIRNIATGFARDGVNHWAGNLPFEDI